MKIRVGLPLAAAIWAFAAISASASGGLEFDGSNDYVTMGAAPGLGSGTFTIETWFQRTGAGLAASTGTGGVVAVPLVGKGRGEGDGTNLDMNYFLGIRESDGVLVADFEEGASGSSPGLNHPVAGVTPVTNNVWHHAAVSYDGSRWQLFLDGTLEADLVIGQPTRADSIQHAALGSALNSSGTPIGAFDGILDEVRIWNYARSATQIADNFQAEIPSESGLVGRWALDETGGTTAADSSGNGIDGTLTNGPVWGTGYSFPALPTVTLISPADQGIEVGPNVTFTCDAQDATGLASATLYVGLEGDPASFLPVETKAISGTSATVNFTTTLLDSTNYVWNCLVANTGGGERLASADFRVLVDANYPDFPTLVAPLSGAIDVPVPPSLQVQVSDPNADPLTVSFYGRATQPADFTVAVIPDTQHYAASLFGGTPQMFQDQTNWIVANQQANNIAFVTHLGDVVQNGDNVQAEWQVAIDALYSLEYPGPTIPEGIPYGLTVGNHDQTPFGDPNGTSIFFNQYFGEAHFAGREYYGGHFGSDNDNNYQLFSASGLDFIVIHLEYDPGANSSVLAWANALLQAHSDRFAVLVTHHLVGPGNPAAFSAQGQAIYDAVKGNPNLILMLGGHITGEGQRQDTFNGNTIHSLLSDYQGRTNGGNGWMRFMEFSPANNEIRVKTYSPTLLQFETDADSEFTLGVPLDPGFQLIGQQLNLPSGSTTSVFWSDAALSSNYEWYVAVTDSTGRQTQGSVWTFDTAASDSTPPVISGIAAINVTDQSAEIIWSTDEVADSFVDYGLSTSYGSLESNPARVASHSVVLTNLTLGQTFHYQVRSTDSSGNASVGPDLTFTTASVDLTPPAPNPMTWASVPASAGPSSITMTATNASDPSGVEYYFENLTAPGHDSGWQGSPIFTDTLLLPSTAYSYRVKTRDLSAANNESSYSSQQSATTGAGSALVLRGPYLQNGKPDGVSIMWRTDNFTDGRVWYGDSPTTLTQVADEPTAPPPFISRGANWKYLDDGSDQGAGWKEPTYNDSSWSMGSAQLGYGDGDEATVVSFGPSSTNKYITTYFRHTFTVTNAAGVSALELGLKRDDGAVIYLNGSEVWRDNMPGGGIIFSTPASSAVGGAAEETFFVTTIDPAFLVEGPNVLAVEIHQANPTSSDISFDLDLYEPQPGGGGDGFDHLVRLGGLNPNTTYYYQVGTAQGEILGGGTLEHYFTTLPTPGSSQPVRIWALGDSGTADANARAVRDAYLDLAAVEQPADILLMLGDNAYNNGTDTEYQNAVFQNMYEDILRNRVLWSTQGNHDIGAYFDIFDLPIAGEAGGVPSGTEDYYSIDIANVHLICLSSQDLSLCSDPNSLMYQWLNADLLATTQPWIIAFWHHPTYSKGSHDSDNAADSGGRMEDMRTIALPILEAGGVDLVLAGHSHSYERSKFINGHFGLSSSFDPQTHVVQTGDGDPAGDGPYTKNGLDGAVYITAGSSGKLDPVAQHAAMQVWLSNLGSVIIDVDGDQLDVRFLRELTNPPQIDDGFRITKNLVPDTDPPTPDPMTWATVPSAIDHSSITMTATTASDPSGVQYSFENLTDSNHNSGWINSASWTDTGLAPSTSYTYRVRARDLYTTPNVTGFSSSESATTSTAPDLTAPTPNPMTWATVPTTIDTTSINMTATTASDPNGVEYFFENVTDPAHDSGWVTDPNWTDTGLTPNTSYTYRVRAHDLSPAQNETASSSSESATTEALPDFTAPTPDPMTWAAVPAAVNTTSIAMTATAANDPSGVEYRFENLTIPGRNSGWGPGATWTDTGLTPDTSYTYQVTARDLSPDQNLTAPSDPASATTAGLQPVVLLFDGFESGDFSVGPWTTQNDAASVRGSAAFTGSEGVELKKTTWIEVAIDTTGHYTLRLKYIRQTSKLDAGEFFYAEWWDGAGWNILEATRDLAWTQQDWPLPASASNNVNFKIRFRQLADNNKEKTRLDNVELTGVPAPPLPAPGQASAPIPAEAASEVSTAVTLSWTAGSDTTSHDVYFGTDPDPGNNPPVNQAETTYNPGALSPGITYYWRIDELNATATTAGPLWTFTTEMAPAAPTGLVATPGDGSVTLDWVDNTEPDLASYNVKRGTNSGGPYTAIATAVPGSAYADNSAVNGTPYYYVVTAVDTDGNESANSNETSATPMDTTPPTAPVDLVATAGDGSVSLDWADSAETDLAGYTVKRATNAAGPYTPIATGLTPSSYADNSAANGTTYYYVVTAVDTSDNESPNSNQASATPMNTTPPAAPAGLVATPGDDSVSLDWADNTETDFASYTLKRGTIDGGPYTQIATGLNFSAYADNGAINGTTYYYVVTAIDTGSNESANSNQASATPMDATPPAAPVGLGAAAGDGSVTLDWADNTETDFASYNLKRGTNAGGPYTLIATGLTTSTYADNGAANGTTYYYVVTAVDTSDNESPNSNQASATPMNTTPPAAPAGLVATPGDDSVSLDWADNTETDFASYTLKRGTIDGGPYTQIATGLTVSAYADNGAINGTTYYYVVTAIDTGSNESANSNQASATPMDATPPAAPVGLGAAAGDGSVTLDWADNTETDFASYNLKRGTNAGGPYTLIATGLTTSTYADNGAANGTTYYYVVTAIDTANNESANSNQASGTPMDTTPPTAPVGLGATAGDGSVTLDWTDNNETDFASYTLKRATSAGGPYTPIATGLTVSASADNSAANGTTYYYVVTAVDTSNNESANSNQASATPMNTTPPAAPAGLVATPGDDSVSLDWADNTETDFASYTLKRGTIDGGPYTQIATGLNFSAYADNGAINGTTYYYVVTAIDTGSNESANSNQASATPMDATPPAAPVGLGAAAGDASVTLDWADNTESDFASYTLQRGTSAGGPYASIATGLTVSAHADNSAVNGTTYYYVVTAVDTVGNESAHSNEASAMPIDSSPPAAPTALAATAGDASVSLDWADNSETDLASYTLKRGTIDGGPYTPIATGLTASTHADTTAVNGTTYYYVVTAVDTSSNESGNSNQASATPFPSDPVIIFSDDFESGDFDAGGWAKQNGDSKVNGDAAFTGDEGALQKKTTWIETAVNTAGHHSIQFRYVRRTEQLDAGEFLYAEWWDGAGWNVVESTQDTTWNTREWNLPSAADGNAELKIRFRLNADNKKEKAHVDDVEVTGIPN